MPDPRIFPIPSAYTDHVTVLAVSTVVRAANVNRVSLDLVNDGDSVVYLSLGNAAVIGDGMRINPRGGSYHIGTSNLFLGAIYGITGDGNMCNMSISEGYKP
jgi:hypothetical protein